MAGGNGVAFQEVKQELTSETTGRLDKEGYEKASRRHFQCWLNCVNDCRASWLNHQEEDNSEVGSWFSENTDNLEGLSCSAALHEMEGNGDDFWYVHQESSDLICSLFNDAVQLINRWQYLSRHVERCFWTRTFSYYQQVEMNEILNELNKLASKIREEEKILTQLVDNFCRYNELDGIFPDRITKRFRQAAASWALGFESDELPKMPMSFF